ncbi:unnamed protein product [Thelazia callipaeda]|uniref:Immunoglobulin domain protein n=1 Tax=Thelazia callipaeda TaxID=103827 RepID=A0A0N5CWP3_THECL|nr:unnamed protein product [Thelazia callipaeda]
MVHNFSSFILLILFHSTQTVITTQGRRFIVDEGNSVNLPCSIHDIADDAVVIWKRGEQVLFTDEEGFHEDPRFHLHRENDNFTLIIDQVEPYDGAKYFCEITSPEMSIVHTLEVNVHPTVSISPDANPLLVNVGDNVFIKCSASGNPLPKVTWTRQDGRAVPARAVSKDGQLRITRVTVNDSGVYECTASNNVGTDAHDTIEVRVQSGQYGAHEPSPPWVDSIYTYIPVRLDQDINLTCKYNAEPSPQVDWFYNGFTINVSLLFLSIIRKTLPKGFLSRKQMAHVFIFRVKLFSTFCFQFSDNRFKGIVQYGTRRDNYSESILAVENIKEDNFGDYTCRVANNLGTKEKTIHVSGRPGPPHLNVSGTQLSWHVHSVDPVIEYQILYRFSSDDTWQQFKSIRANKEEQDGDIWSRSEDLVWLRPDVEYELQVKARNKLGWGSLARSYVTMKTPPLENVTNSK